MSSALVPAGRAVKASAPRERQEIQPGTGRTSVGGVGLRTVYMVVDLDQAMPVGGPYLDLEHSRDAWHWLTTPGLNLSHLQLVVRDRQDLVAQVRTWSVDHLRQREQDELQRRRARANPNPCRGCG